MTDLYVLIGACYPPPVDVATEVTVNTNTRDPGVPRSSLLERESERLPPCGLFFGPY
jgi:hypothetical protein